MSESFLHYVWQFQYFEKTNLLTTNGESIQVLNTGIRNEHAGPDFFNARLKIGEIEWVGSVEIHIQSSNWSDHQHQKDEAYNNVVLHVVWSDDKPVRRSDNSNIPTLELQKRVSAELILKYQKIVNGAEEIPCSKSLALVDDITKFSMLDKSLAIRLEKKARIVVDMLERNNQNWEETSYQMLCKNFGFKVNTDPFLQLAQALPFKTLLKHSDNLLQIEALLFGQAGFLNEEIEADEYYNLLKREFNILNNKYSLDNKQLNKSQWKFLRLRPANFPTIRLAQLAQLIYLRKNIFSIIIESNLIKELRALFLICQSEYWLHHYQFSKQATTKVDAFGNSSVDNILINTVVPILAAYGRKKDDTVYIDRAIEILQAISSENNSIIRKWNLLDFNAKSAFDSQAMIELYNSFCLKHQCLNCNIGASLIRPK